MKIQKEHENTIMPEPVSCLLPHSKVCINLLNDLLIFEDVINCKQLFEKCLQSTFDRDGLRHQGLVFLLIFLILDFARCCHFQLFENCLQSTIEVVLDLRGLANFA